MCYSFSTCMYYTHCASMYYSYHEYTNRSYNVIIEIIAHACARPIIPPYVNTVGLVHACTLNALVASTACGWLLAYPLTLQLACTMGTVHVCLTSILNACAKAVIRAFGLKNRHALSPEQTHVLQLIALGHDSTT